LGAIDPIGLGPAIQMTVSNLYVFVYDSYILFQVFHVIVICAALKCL